MPRTSRLPALLAVALAVAGCGVDGGDAVVLRISAAASLRELAAELATAFERGETARVELNLAGSNTLAQQILAAPGADLFLSADRHWVEVLERAGRALPDSRRPVLSNRLVLIERAGAGSGVERPEELAGDHRRLALADPQAVPAGRYAKSALEGIGVGGRSVWQAVAERVVPALDARAALALVESDPEILGIVYRTDALSSSRVRVLYEFPQRGAAAVTYWAVRLADGRNQELAGRFVDFLGTPAARAIAERQGFGVLADGPPAAESGA